MEDAKKNAPKSHMAKHRDDKHPEVEDASKLFKVKVIANSNSALERQIKEAVLIQAHGGGLLNDKEEYNRCLIPQLAVKVGKQVVEEEKVIAESGIDELIREDKKRKESPEITEVEEVKVEEVESQNKRRRTRTKVQEGDLLKEMINKTRIRYSSMFQGNQGIPNTLRR